MKQTVDELRQTRAQNLRMLVSAFGSCALLGRHIGPTADPYIRSIVSPGAKRTCGPNFADRIERALNLPAGWLSQTHDENEFRAVAASAGTPDAAQPAAKTDDALPAIFGRPVEQLIIGAPTPFAGAGDIVLYDTLQAADRRAGLYVIDAAGARLVGQLTINLAGAQFTVDADTVPADTVKFIGRVVGIIKRIP